MNVNTKDPIQLAIQLSGLPIVSDPSNPSNRTIELRGTISVWAVEETPDVPGRGYRCKPIYARPDFVIKGRELLTHRVWVYGSCNIRCDTSSGSVVIEGGRAILRVSDASLTATRTILTTRDTPEHTSTSAHRAKIAMFILEVFRVTEDPKWRDRVSELTSNMEKLQPSSPFLRELKAMK